ncbi:MAG: serine protease [Syntrophobacteraceae bacterium]
MMWSCRWITLVISILFVSTGCASHTEAKEFGGSGANPVQASSGYADVKFDVNHINNCVYEVIVPKPLNDPIAYEKPLPLDQLPFKFRNDKYFSIGTAFAYTPTEFATAAHVLNLLWRSHFKDPLIRDIKGNVFSIDKIVKFSNRRDFAVFTVKGRQSSECLETNETPEIGGKVFAVGNALGEGLVIRDGLYTSNTPEPVDGKWSLIRFSAAASPGNSGGPLLDKNGKVIGIVLIKSPNENLNAALPISEVNRDDGKNAEIYLKIVEKLEIFDFVKAEELSAKVKLPLSYGELKKACSTSLRDFSSRLRTELLAENKANTFPNGSGSDKLMYTSSAYPFPQVITRREGGNWGHGQPKDIKRIDLDGNGKIAYGIVGLTTFAKLDKPDNISLKDIYSDSKAFMDLMLKAIEMTRPVGREKIRITSLGKADNEYTFTDAYGRKWLVRTWPIEYTDGECAAFILPLPDGCAVMMKVAQSGAVLDEWIADLKVLTGFFNVWYSATFKQWREYLELKDILPSVFANIDVKLPNDSLSFKSPVLQAKCDCNTLNITDNSVLTIWFNFFRNKGSVVWEPKTVWIGENKFAKTGFHIIKDVKPNSDDEKNTDRWLRLTDGRQPFDGKVTIKDEATSIWKGCKRPGSEGTNGDCAVLYSVKYTKSGTVSQEEMESGLNSFMKNVVINEN